MSRGSLSGALAGVAVAGALAVAPVVALADTLVSAGGKPGVATAWKASGDATVLTIKEGFDPAEVADAIGKGVPGAKAKPGEGSVTVSGVAQAALLSALERIEVDPALDGIDAMFAATQNQAGSEDEGSGSSIRATKSADMSAAMEGPAIGGTVVEVRHKRFPLVALTVRVDQVPDGVSEVKKGKTVTVVPAIRMKGSSVDASDPQSQKNIAAWYARPGDKVSFRLGAKEAKLWVATTFERVR